MASSGYRERCIEEKGERCDLCGSTENIQVHHIDGNQMNDSLENLLPLCSEHHSEVHADNGLHEELSNRLPDDDWTTESVRITVTFTEELINGVELTAKEEGLSTSAAVRELTRSGLENNYKQEKEALQRKVVELRRELDRAEHELGIRKEHEQTLKDILTS